jgi:hypothetical protein
MNYDFLKDIDLNLGGASKKSAGAAPSGQLATTQNWVYGNNQSRPNFTAGRPEPLPRQKLLGHNGYTEFREKPPEAPQPPKYTEKVTNPNVGSRGSAEAKAFSEGYSNQSMQGDPTKNKPAQRVDVASKSLRDRVVGSADDWAKFGNNAVGNMSKAASAAYKPVAALGKGALKAAPVAGAAMGVYEGADAYKRGDKSDMAWAAGDVAASAAMFTPAMPLAATYLATRGVYEGGKALHDYAKQPKADSAVEMPKVEAMQQQQPAQTASLRDPYAEANAAKIAALSGTNPELSTTQTTVKAGDRRNVDGFGNLLDPNTEQVYAGPGRGWETRSSEQGNRERLRKEQEHKELYARNYAEATKDGPGGVFGRSLRYMQEMKNQDYMDLLRQKASLGDKRAAKQFRELLAVNATIEDTRATKQSGLRSQQLAEERLSQTALRDSYERDRNYNLDRLKVQSEGNKVRAEEATELRKEKADNYDRRVGEVERKMGDDKAKQSEYMTFMDNFRVSKANAAKERGDMEAYNQLMKEDYVMDAAARAEGDTYWNVREKTKQKSGWMPGTGHFADSLNPEDYFIEEIEDNRFGLGAGKAKLRNGSSVYVNDLYDKDLIGPKKDSRFDKVVDEARVRTKNKEAAREATLRMYQ